MEVGVVVVLVVVVPRILRLQPPGPEVSLGVRGEEPAPTHQVEVTGAGHQVTLLPGASLVMVVAVVSVEVWQAAPPGPLAGLLEEPHLVLVLLAVVLHVLPQAAGVSVPLVAASHLTLVRLLQGGERQLLG